jgi:hypothetical protein
MNTTLATTAATLLAAWISAPVTPAQLVWLPICPDRGVQEVPAERRFGPPAGGTGPSAWAPSWVMWTPAHRNPVRVPGHYLRAVRQLPIRMAWLPADPRLFLRGPYQERVVGTVTDAMPALCALPLRR